MSSVRAGLTEPLQQLESLRSIQCLLRDGGKNWLDHLNRCAQCALSAFRLLYLTGSLMDRVPASTTLGAAFGINADAPELNEAMLVRHTLSLFRYRSLSQMLIGRQRTCEVVHAHGKYHQHISILGLDSRANAMADSREGISQT